MSGANETGGPRKRWDQFGRYTNDTRLLETLERSVDGEPIAIPFGDDGRRLCFPAAAMTLCQKAQGGFIAMEITSDFGVFAPMDSDAARSLARNLVVLADRLDAAQ